MQSALTERNNELLDQSREAGPLYGPTPFWQAGADRLMAGLDQQGMACFRRHPAALAFFVPTYGYPGNSLSQPQIDALRGAWHGETPAGPKQQQSLEQYITGELHALSDYRAFAAGARHGSAARLLNFSESDVGEPVEQFIFDGRRYSRSALNYLLGLVFLANHTDLGSIDNVVEIGGGFGTLGEILAQCWPKDGFRYVDLDIPPTCFFADFYLSKACAEIPRRAVGDMLAGAVDVNELPPLTVQPNWCVENLRGSIDLFVNFISFQEMEPDVVENYLNHIDRLAPRWVLLRNMREGKQQRTASNPIGVATPIKAPFYASALKNYQQVATDTTIYGFRTSDGFHSDLMLFERSNAAM